MKRTSPRRITKIHDDSRPIVFFDGVCGLCNGVVDTLLRVDRRNRLLFAPLQGETALARLGEATLNSIVLVDTAGRHEKSAAALRICLHIGGLWQVLLIFWLLPRPLRDALYDFIARNRYAWFGKHELCRLPTPQERARFLP